MFNVRLAGGYLYGKQLSTWLSLMVSLSASFCAVLFPLDVLDKIWDLTESVSEGFFTYSYTEFQIIIGAEQQYRFENIQIRFPPYAVYHCLLILVM